MKKITLATFKSFIKKNEGKLFVKVKSSFDSMIDCVSDVKGDFTPAEKRRDQRGFASNDLQNATLGYEGIWLVRGSGDWFTNFENDIFTGFEVSNCCGSFVVAVKK